MPNISEIDFAFSKSKIGSKDWCCIENHRGMVNDHWSSLIKLCWVTRLRSLNRVWLEIIIPWWWLRRLSTIQTPRGEEELSILVVGCRNSFAKFLIEEDYHREWRKQTTAEAKLPGKSQLKPSNQGLIVVSNLLKVHLWPNYLSTYNI